MLTTACDTCGKKIPIKINNSSRYWYCIFCKSQLHLKKIQDLPPGPISKKAHEEYPQATHFIMIEGNVTLGGPVVIDVPLLSSATKDIPPRPERQSLLLFAFLEGQEKKLGEIFYCA